MNRGIKILGSILILLFISLHTKAAYSYLCYTALGDTSEKAVKKLSNKEAHKAAIFSTILPGMGQAYNKKYWKIPIIYAALAGMGYLTYYLQQNYQMYHKELLIRYQHGDSLSSYQHYSNPDLVTNPTSFINDEKL